MSKTTTAIALTGVALAGLAAFGFTQTAQADENDLSQSIVTQAEAIGADVEEQCQLPLRDAAERATADPNALAEYEAMGQKCRAIGNQYAYFVDVVTAHADAVTASIPEEARAAAEAAMAAATSEVKAQVEAGDAEGAVRSLFASIAPSYDVESEVSQ